LDHFHMRAPARAGPSHDVDQAIVIEVGRRHTHAALECRNVGKETAHFSAGRSVKYLHVRAAARAGAHDDVGHAVAIQVAAGNIHAAKECGAKCHEAADKYAGGTVEHLNVRPAARTRAGDNVGHAIAVNIGAADRYSAHKTGIRDDIESLAPVAVENANLA